MVDIHHHYPPLILYDFHHIEASTGFHHGHFPRARERTSSASSPMCLVVFLCRFCRAKKGLIWSWLRLLSLSHHIIITLFRLVCVVKNCRSMVVFFFCHLSFIQSIETSQWLSYDHNDRNNVCV
jgi:hypothetical protein